jgi:hypothetical protein
MPPKSAPARLNLRADTLPTTAARPRGAPDSRCTSPVPGSGRKPPELRIGTSKTDARPQQRADAGGAAEAPTDEQLATSVGQDLANFCCLLGACAPIGRIDRVLVSSYPTSASKASSLR